MEITCPEPAYSDILPNATLANLYESNGKAVGMQFPEQPAKFHGIFIKKDKKTLFIAQNMNYYLSLSLVCAEEM